MKIAYFYNEDWEIDYVKERLPEQEILFLKGSTTDHPEVRDPEVGILSVFVNSSPENRVKYERLEQEASDARKIFDEKITNKDILIKHLYEAGEKLLADRISKMFGLSKE